jgi:putative N6-adenine-specific DNA methylase
MDNSNFKFFLITLPGLEDLAYKELCEKSKLYEQELLNIAVIEGGVEFEVAEIAQGFNVNHYSKIGTRLLLRIDEFKARDFPKLFNKLKKINWNTYISGSKPELSFSSKKSKIFDDRKVKNCLHDAMDKFFDEQPPKKKYLEKQWHVTPTVYMRFLDDVCTLSLDTTGERLDKRGQKLFSAEAPIRESIAAAMAYTNFKDLKTRDLDKVVDPMCGSGSLLFEYVNFYKLNYQRDFLYTEFPKIQIKKIRFEQEEQYQLLARDLKEDNIEAVTKNANNFEISKIDTKVCDLFKNDESFENSLVVLNPPYNKRIKVDENIHLFIDKLLTHLIEINKAKAISLVMPQTFKIKNYKDCKLIRSKAINNGGIKVAYFHLRK